MFSLSLVLVPGFLPLLREYLLHHSPALTARDRQPSTVFTDISRRRPRKWKEMREKNRNKKKQKKYIHERIGQSNISHTGVARHTLHFPVPSTIFIELMIAPSSRVSPLFPRCKSPLKMESAVTLVRRHGLFALR